MDLPLRVHVINARAAMQTARPNQALDVAVVTVVTYNLTTNVVKDVVHVVTQHGYGLYFL